MQTKSDRYRPGLAARLLQAVAISPILLGALSSAALAQATAPVDTAGGRSDGAEVVITGTRIPHKQSLLSNSPVTVIDQKDIEVSGITDVATLLQRQPQVGIGTNTSNTTNTVRNQGIETLSLRNLGTARTLVLVDGHRQVGGQAGSSAVDVNTISTTLIDRVDVVTGGSSALYGADAIAGVVNFILKKDFDGVAAKVQYGDSDAGGGTTYVASATVGHNFDGGKGNITFSAVFNQTDPILRSQRDYALDYLTSEANPNRTTPLSGSGTANIAVLGVGSNTLNISNAPVIWNPVAGHLNIPNSTTSTTTNLTFDATGNLILFNQGNVLRNSAGQALTGSINCPMCFADTLSALQDRLQKQGVESTGRYELRHDWGVIRNLEAYYEGKYYHTDGWTQSSTGTFEQSGTATTSFIPVGGTTPVVIPAAGSSIPVFLDNAFIPASLRAILAATPQTNLTTPSAAGCVNGCLLRYNGSGSQAGAPEFLLNRVDNDFGTRDFKTGYDSFETVAGLRGEFINGWRFDAFVNYGQTNATARNFDRDQVKFFQQVDAVKNASGQIVCRSTLTNPNNGCVPINIFSTQNTAAAKAYSYLYTTEHDQVALWNAQANVNGELIHFKSLGSGTDLPISFATGVEFRREASENVPDVLNQVGEIFGNKLSVNKGSYSTKEWYGEINVPVVADVPFAKRIEIDGSARYQDYTTTGGDWTYGLNGFWAITDDIKARGAWSKAVRAPNINELFAGGSANFLGIVDPCDASNVGLGQFPANRLANCKAALGVLAGGATYSFASSPSTKQTETLGNPNLAPERATTYTGGFVITPRFIPRLQLTVDYYDIKINGFIGALAAQTVVNDCYEATSLANAFCAKVTRGSDGNIANVVSSNFNIGLVKTKGVDFGASYAINLRDMHLHLPDAGRLTFSANANVVMTLLQFAVAGDPTTRQQGAGSLLFDQPKFKANTRVLYEYGPFSASWAVEYLGPMVLNNADVPFTNSFEHIPGWYQHDIHFERKFNYAGHPMSGYVGINNLFDNAPPFIPGVYTGTATASIYGPIGRFYYAGLNINF